MKIRIVAELDPNVTEHGAKESMDEAKVAMAGVMDVVSVSATLIMTELPSDEADEKEDDDEFEDDLFEDDEDEDDDVEDEDDSGAAKKSS